MNLQQMQIVARLLMARFRTSPRSEMTPEEQKAAEEKKAMIAKAKARGAEKAKLTKSMIIMDVKPWDDTTGAPWRPPRKPRWPAAAPPSLPLIYI